MFLIIVEIIKTLQHFSVITKNLATVTVAISNFGPTGNNFKGHVRVSKQMHIKLIRTSLETGILQLNVKPFIFEFK